MKPCPQCRGKRFQVQVVSGVYQRILCPACRGTGERLSREFPLWAWWLLALLFLAVLLWGILMRGTRPDGRKVAWTVPAGGALDDRRELAGTRDPRIWRHEVLLLNGWGNRVPLLRAGEEVELWDWREEK